MRLGARHGVSKAERITLPGVVDGRELGDRPHLLQLVELALRLEIVLQLRRPIEVVLDRPLTAAGHHQDVADPGTHGFLDHELDRRRVDDRQHLLGGRLGRGQETRAESRHRDHGVLDLHAGNGTRVAEKMSATNRATGRLPAEMPTYEYTCRDCGHTFDIVQSMWDEALTMCPECGGSLRKVFAPPAISFKGSGFYATDHGRRSKRSDDAKD